MLSIKDMVVQEKDNIKVSVIILTYFHEDYIIQAIDSVLSQITDYKYEIIISDDGSTDNTVGILKKYKSNYPEKIKLLIHDKNIGLTNNQYEARCIARGKYILALSGDDYWIDKKKIQKQVDFMDNNPQFIAVTTVIEQRYDNDVEGQKQYPKKLLRGKGFYLRQFLHNCNYPTHGSMMKNLYLSDEGKKYMGLIPQFSPYIDDLTESILLLKLSPIFVLNQCTYVYRVNRDTSGKNNFNSINSFFSSYKKHIELMNAISLKFGDNLHLRQRYAKLIAMGLLRGIKGRNLLFILKINQTIPPKAKKPFVNYTIEIIIEILRIFINVGMKIIFTKSRLNSDK